MVDLDTTIWIFVIATLINVILFIIREILYFVHNHIKIITPDYRENFEVRESDGICHYCLFFHVVSGRKGITLYCSKKGGRIPLANIEYTKACFISQKKYLDEHKAFS